MSIYYKAVTKDLQSYSKLYEVPHRVIQYKLGEFVYPKAIGTFLFVFDTLENAINLTGNNNLFDIYECECECVTSITPHVHMNADWPKGTCFAYGVKLTNKVNVMTPFSFYSANSKKIDSYDVDSGGKITPHGTMNNNRKPLNYNGENYFEVANQDGTGLLRYHFENWRLNYLNNPTFTTKNFELAKAVHLCLKSGISVP